MNYTFRSFLTILIFAFFSDVNGQWLTDPSIYGGPVNKIRELGEDIFILSNNSLFKSEDLGQSWHFLDQIPEAIHDFAVNEKSGLIAAITTHTNKFYISRDTGESWELIGESEGEHILLTDKSIFSFNYNLNRSNDLGQTWENIFERAGTPGIPTDLATIGDTLFLGTGFTNVGYGLQRSNDNGDSWNRVSLPGTPDRIYKVDTFDSLIYVSALGSNGIFSLRSDDYGESWTNIGEVAPGIKEHYNFDHSGDTLVVCDYDKLRISFDHGINWSALNLPAFEKWNPIMSISLIDSNLFIGTQNGIYYSNDMGTSWESRTEGIYASFFWMYYKKTNKNLYLIRDAQVYKRNGNTFNRLTLPSSNELGRVYTEDSLLLVTHYDNSGNQGTLYDHYLSFDEGLTFSKLDLPRDKWFNGILHFNDQYIISLDGGIYRSKDAINWQKVYSAENQYQRIEQICTFNNEIFGLSNGLISSKDEGDSWDLIKNTPIDTLFIQSISSSSNYLYITWIYEKEIAYNYYRRESGAYRYDGLEWELINHNPNQSLWQKLYVDGTFVSLLSNGSILLSNYNGDSFKNFRMGINSNRIEPMELIAFQDSLFLILDGGGAWKGALNEMNFSPIPTPHNLQGVYNGQSVTLSWEADPGMHDGFIIERADNNLENFIEYDLVGPETREYTDTDSYLNSQSRITYRISSFDSDGLSLPTNTFTANYLILDIREESGIKKLNVFPNPVSNELNIEFQGNLPVSLKAYDLLGNVLKLKPIQFQNKVVRIDLEDNTNKVLILAITLSDGTVEFHKIIRQQ